MRRHALVPVVLVTGVLPGTREENMLGALMSYHSLRRKGSTLQGREGKGAQQGKGGGEGRARLRGG